MEDQSIVALYMARREEAITRTDEKYRRLAVYLAGNILTVREDVEECVSDAYLTLWNTIPPQHPKRLGAYLAKVTRSLAIDRWRRGQTKKRGGGQIVYALVELEYMVSSDGSAEDTVLKQELRETLGRFLAGLSDTQRRAFLMRYWYFASAQDIAGELGMTGAGVRTMLHRLRKQLKAYLEQEGMQP